MTLSVEQLSCGYGDMQVVRDLSFVAKPGQVVALLGRNGAGKTSTLRAISGLITIHGGHIHVNDRDITRMPAYRRVKEGLAFVQEGKRVFRQRTVHENLTIGAYSTRLTKRELAERLERAYDTFPILQERKDRSAGELSGGQQQMLSIAQNLMRNPAVLLLDEPSAGLAPAIVSDVYEVIASLRDQGLTVVLVEQAVGWAQSVADRIVLMEHGRKTFEGDIDGPGAAEALARIDLAVDSSVGHSL